MIQLEDGEIKLINILAANSQKAKSEFDNCMTAQTSLVALIENKYNATFNRGTGAFESKKSEGKSKVEE